MTVTFPRWIYYADGYGCVVSTPEELAHQPPGYANNYVGPFPETGQGWAWELGKGPFAPYEGWGQSAATPHPQASVYACRPLIVNTVAYAKGEVFSRGTVEIEERIEAGHVKPVPPGAQLVKHDMTGRWFLGAVSRDVYAKLYKARDSTPWLEAPTPEGALER